MLDGRRLAATFGALLLAAFLITGCSGSDDDPPPDFASPDFVTSLVSDLGAEPEAITEGVLSALLGDDVSPEQREELVTSLAQILAPAASADRTGGTTAGGGSAAAGAAVVAAGDAANTSAATTAVLDGLVRRLGADATTASNADELIALLVEAIDPNGLIDSPEDLLSAVASWAAANPANVLRIVSAAEALAGPLSSIESASFEDIVAVLEQYAFTAEVLDIPLSGIEGLETLTIPGVRWDIDQPTRSVTFSGDTTLFEERVALLLSAHWGEDETASIVVAVRAANWSLEGFGVSGPLGDYLFPDLTFVVSGHRELLAPRALSPLTTAFLAETYAAELDDVRIVPGVNLFAALPLSTLPDSALNQLGISAGNSLVGLSGALGSSFAVIAGDDVDDRTSLNLQATLPPIEPPLFPDWLTSPDDASWSLTLAYEDEQFTFGLAGQLEALIDGARRPFLVRFDLASNSNSAAGLLVGELTEPWQRPFGVEWLTFDNLRLELSLEDEDALARFTAKLRIASREATLVFELKNGESGGSVDLTARMDEITLEEMVAFIAGRLGAAAPARLPDLSLDNISLGIGTGRDSYLSFSASTSLFNRPSDLLVSAISVNGGKPEILIGLGLPDWKLADAIPSLQGSLLDQIEFPSAALSFGSIDAKIPSAELPIPVRNFFAFNGFGLGSLGGGGASSGSNSGSGSSGAGGLSGLADFDLDLKSGLSMFSNISFEGTEFASPMESLGFSGATFPVLGTLPGSILGLGGGSGSGRGGSNSGGGSSGGSLLADLDLSVSLPAMSPPGAPEWFKSGQLSLVINGQPSIAFEGQLTVVVDEEDLTFVVGAAFERSTTGVSLSLYGALETERPWEQPFGIEWLTLNRVAVELSVDAIGNVGVGFAGSMILGTKDIEVAVKLEVNATGVPTNFIVAGASDEGISTTDLVMLQNRIAAAANPNAPPVNQSPNYAELALRDIQFQFAPKASPTLGVDAGFVLAGDAFIAFDGGAPSRFAFLDFRLTTDGLYAVGHLQAYELGPLSWSDVDLDVEISLQDQHLFFNGAVDLFGAEARVNINLSTGSIFFAGQQALEDLKLIIQAFEAFVNDPVAALDQLPLLFRELGVAQPAWLTELVTALQLLLDKGQQGSEAAINTILNGGTIPLIEWPIGGNPRKCAALTPFEVVGRCYTIPPAASPGVPLGGYPYVCGVLTPFESGGRCYTVAPSSSTACPLWAPFAEGGKCYSIVPTFLDPDGTPNGGTSKVTTVIPGVPSGGAAKDSCLAIYPFDFEGRCYSIPPGQLLAGTPEGGDPLVCGALVPTFEDGRCWTVSPSEADAGLRTPGICTTFAGVACSWDQLVQQDLRPLLLGPLVERLNRWE